MNTLRGAQEGSQHAEVQKRVLLLFAQEKNEIFLPKILLKRKQLFSAVEAVVAHTAGAAFKCTYKLSTPKNHSSEIIGKARDTQLSGSPLHHLFFPVFQLYSSMDWDRRQGTFVNALVSRQWLAYLPSFGKLQLMRCLSD